MNNRIFIADDSDAILAYFTSLLGGEVNVNHLLSRNAERDGTYQLETFKDGDVLLKRFKSCYAKKEYIPLCILDMRMARMDGLQTAKEIRKIDESAQIIIVTAFNDVSIADLKKELKNDVYYVKKPFNEEEILVLIRSLINNWNTRREYQKLKQDFSGQIKDIKKLLDANNQKIKKQDEQIKKLTQENAGLRHEMQQSSGQGDPKKLKTAFLLNMSHEIRTPMNAIVGFSDLLGDPDLTDDQREEFIELINNSGTDLLNLVDDIIDISRIDSGSFSISKEKVNLNKLLEDIERQTQELFRIKKIRGVELVIENKLNERDAVIVSNEFRIRQIITKLLNNALKFTKTGTIIFGVERKDKKHLLFFVKDNGIGLSETKQSQVFDLFSEFDDSYTKKYGGTRTGLHLSKQITEMMGGKMWLESKLGEGSCFYFTLPHEKLEAGYDQPVSAKKSIQVYDWSDKTFIVAEDVEFNYMYLEELLQKTKAKILWAKNGQEALYFFENDPNIDLVLMDLQMPVMNGFEATREIKNRFPHVPVIVQTAYTVEEERQKSMDAGCDAFLSKPIKPKELYDAMAKFVE